MGSVCDMTPTEVRDAAGSKRLLVTFAWSYLTRAALDAWLDLDELFELRIA
jgi:hypothetical protein